MRRILVESARQKAASSAVADLCGMTLNVAEVASSDRSEELLAVNDALDKLREADAASADMVKLRYFAGLTHEGGGRIAGNLAANGSIRTGLSLGPGCYEQLRGRRNHSTGCRNCLQNSLADFLAAITHCPTGSSTLCMSNRRHERTQKSSPRALENSTSPADRLSISRRSLRRRSSSAGTRGSNCYCREHEAQAASWNGPPLAIDATVNYEPPIAEGPARSSAPTSSCSKSAKAAWASSSWPSRPSRSSGRSR